MTLFGVVVPVILLVAIGVLLSFSILIVKKYLSPGGETKLLVNEEKEEMITTGGTLLETLLKLGYGIPAPCGGKATCHQCKVKVTDGGGEPVDVETMVFSPKKIKAGWRLSCQCKVRGEIKVHIDPSAMNVQTFKGKVVSNKNVSTFIKELCVQIPEGEEIKYIPGDYMQIHLPKFVTNTEEWKSTIDEEYQKDWNTYSMFNKELRFGEEGEMRAYSLASHPLEGNLLKFTIRIATPPFKKGVIAPKTPWGLGSSYAFSLKEGDEIEMSGAYGESHMLDDDRELVFLIGGAGASFGRSHILDLFKRVKTKRKVTLWYGARSLKENIYQEEFEALAKEYENFDYRLVLSEPEDEDFKNGWPKDDPLKTGFAANAFKAGQLENMESPEDALYYVCGPPMHNKTVMSLLHSYGVERESVVLDDFGN